MHRSGIMGDQSDAPTIATNLCLLTLSVVKTTILSGKLFQSCISRLLNATGVTI